MGIVEEVVLPNGSWRQSALILSRPSVIMCCSVTISGAAQHNIKEEQPDLREDQGHAVYTGFGSHLLFPY